MNIRRAVVYAFMLEEAGGVMDKSPSDIWHMFEQVSDEDLAKPELMLLGPEGFARYEAWKKKWNVKI